MKDTANSTDFRLRLPTHEIPHMLGLDVTRVIAGLGVIWYHTANAYNNLGYFRMPFFTALQSQGGSNAWAVAAARSASGGPLLAADPHRLLATPALRYLVHLTAPGWNVAGATAPTMSHVSLFSWENRRFCFAARFMRRAIRSYSPYCCNRR